MLVQFGRVGIHDLLRVIDNVTRRSFQVGLLLWWGKRFRLDLEECFHRARPNGSAVHRKARRKLNVLAELDGIEQREGVGLLCSGNRCVQGLVRRMDDSPDSCLK